MSELVADMAQLLVNTLTLTSPALDPTGICIDPLIALVNHSCEPNAFIVFDGRRLSLRSLTAIPEAKEITISYIDPHDETRKRQSDLMERYFFQCQCNACTSADSSPMTNEQKKWIKRCRRRTAAILSQVPKDFSQTLDEFHPENVKRPYGNKDGIKFKLTGLLDYYVAMKKGELALDLVNYIYEFTECGPYPQPWHPVRLTETWILAMKMIDWPYIDGLGIAKIGPVYATVLIGMLREVRDNVNKTHEPGSAFSNMVFRKCAELREDFQHHGLYMDSI